LSVSHSTAPLTEFTVHCRQWLGHAAADMATHTVNSPK